MKNFTLPCLLLVFTCFFVTALHAQPTIASFTPLSGPAGTTVTITGTNFNTTAASNVVFFGATRATVTAASTASLTVTVPAGATYAPITVLNTGTMLAVYSDSNFNPTYSPNIGYIVSNNFAAGAAFATGSSPNNVAIGDLDGDGLPDLAVTNSASSTVSVLLNTGSGGGISFAAKVDFVTGSFPNSVAIGDIDGDGKPDLVVVDFVFSNKSMSVLRNKSSVGSLSFATHADFAAGDLPIGVAIDDLDGDGKPDVVVGNFISATVAVLRNTSSPGSISFATQATFAAGSETQDVAIGDIDGDGLPDVVTANEGSSSVSVLRNTGSPGSISFAAHADFATDIDPFGVAIGDIDGDGKLDLAVANHGDSSVSVLLNTSSPGSPSFAAKADFRTGNLPGSVAIGDIDGDGRPDLTVGNSPSAASVSVLRNTGSIGSISFAAQVKISSSPSSQNMVAVGDLNGDGKPDIAYVSGVVASVTVLENISAFNIWAGTTSTDWATGSNWSYGIPPNSPGSAVVPLAANQPIISGSTNALTDSLYIATGASVTVNGTLQINGNLNDTSSITGTGTLTLSGSTAQTIGGGGTVNIANLTINNSGAGVTIAAGTAVTVQGVYNPEAGVLTTNGGFTLASTATGTASVAEQDNGGYITGSVNVQRYLPGHRAWRLLTAPLSGTGTIYANWQNNGVVTDSTGALMWKPGGGGGFTAGGIKANIRAYDPIANGWYDLSNTNATNLSGSTGTADNNGFALFATGPYGSTDISTASGATATTLVATGSLQTGEQVFNYTGISAGDFILVGNPYAGPVDFTNVGSLGAFGGGNITENMWAWDAQRSGTSYGGYVTFSWDQNNEDYDQDIDPSQTDQTIVMQSGESVFVQAAADGPVTLTFDEFDKADTSAITGGVFGVHPPSTAQQLRITLSRHASGVAGAGGKLTPVDGVLAKFGEKYSVGTKDDAPKLNDYDENLSIMIGTSHFAIERRPLPVPGDTIFLNMDALKNDTGYAFTFSPQNLQGATVQAWLVDNYLNTKTQVSLTGSTTVNFSTGSDAGSLSQTRFNIIFITNGSLATTLANVKAWPAGSGIQVQWSAPNEQGVKQYQVGRSTDGQNFETVHAAAALNTGNTQTYNWLDSKPLSGGNYYRITVYNTDGTASYSNVVLVKAARAKPAFSIYPNPVQKSRQLTALFSNMAEGKYTLQVYDNTGKQLLNNTVAHNGVTAAHTVTLPAGLAAGSYRLVLLDGNGNKWEQQLVVE